MSLWRSCLNVDAEASTRVGASRLPARPRRGFRAGMVARRVRSGAST